MKCIKCGHQMEPEAPRTLLAEVRGESVEVRVNVSQCSHCGRVLLRGKSRRAYHRAASDGYRRAHSLLTTTEIHQLRTALGMTWKQFAVYTTIGVATLKRWMAGEIQSPSLDSLVRLKADPAFAEQALQELVSRLAINEKAFVACADPARRVVTTADECSVVEMMATDTQLGLAA